MTELTWQRRHVISLADFTPNDYETVLQTAVSFVEVLSRRNKKVPTLQSKVVANLFFESSTRTRNSFELAAKRLSADTLNFAPGTSSLSKGETILDTARTFLAMGTDIMVIRHQSAGVPLAIARDMDALSGKVAILNAGDGKHEHPSQALLDLLTLCMYMNPTAPTAKDLKGKKVAIIGDILHSRVARSNLWSLITNGADVHLAAPPTLLPPEFAEYGAKIHYSLEPALEDADFVMTLRLQMERMGQFLIPSLREYHARYGITRDRLARGIFLQPFFDKNNNGIRDEGEDIYTDDIESLFLINSQALIRFGISRPKIVSQGLLFELPPNTYRLDIDPSGCPLGWKALQTGYAVKVTSGTYTTIAIPLVPSYVVTGTAIAKDGKPMIGANVEFVSRSNPKQRFTSITNNAGIYYLENLTVDIYQLFINGNSAQSNILEINSDSKNFLELNIQP